jgi:hypothetical protein
MSVKLADYYEHERMCVYFAQAESGGPIKIGSSHRLRERNQHLKSHSPIPIKIIAAVRGSRRHERGLHEYFADHRSHGEWFNPCPELVEFIESLPPWQPEIDELDLPRFTHDQRDLFNAIYRAGYRITDIADHFGYSRQRADQQVTCERYSRIKTLRPPRPDKPIAEFIDDLLGSAVSLLAVEYPK